LVQETFIRSLRVLPLVFVNVIIAVVDMMAIGRAGSIGWKTTGLHHDYTSLLPYLVSL
jgi:Na+/H+-dicarboxylate symporter